MKVLTAALTLFLAINFNGYSQTTYSLVYNLFQTHCAASCHNSASPDAQLDLSAAPATVYSSIVNKAPVNQAASSKGDKLIMPGYPQRSFLLRKCDNILDAANVLDLNEGELMPGASSTLPPQDLELLRQWILYGAPQSGNHVDTSVINKYYRGKGIASPEVPLPLPAVPGAFQVHVGKIFLAPASEFQFYIKQDILLADTVEVYRMDAMLGDRGHHFNMLKFNPGAASSFAEGIRDITKTSHLSAEVIGAFQHSYNLELPPGTAYLWEAGIVLDINFHIINPDQDSVLAVDLYINVYTQPEGTAQDIMKIKWYSNFLFAIPFDNTEHEFIATGNETDPTKTWQIWMMSSHTHKYGTDFDIFLRNPDGSEGQQLYEGFYNPEYQFNQGFYDWQHPARRYFDPFVSINPMDGFIYKTKFKNNSGPGLVLWGATASDEMMIMYLHYIEKEVSTAVSDIEGNISDLNIYPNPVKNSCQLSFELKDNSKVLADILNIHGQTILSADWGELPKGKYSKQLRVSVEPGYYFVRLLTNDKSRVKPLIVE